MKIRELVVDFCVVGGGVAGVCAAVSAARNGARVALVQNRSVLGGNSSSEIRMHIVGADAHGHKPGARETGLMEELRLLDAANNPQRSFTLWDLLLYDKVASEPGITLLLDTTVVDADVTTLEAERERSEDPAVRMQQPGTRVRIDKVIARRDSTEEIFHITAKFYADCSGDGRLGLESGADYTEGREAAAEFSESLATPTRDSHRLGSSIMLMARAHPNPMPFKAPKWARRFSREDFALGRHVGSYEYGYWWFEWGGHLDTIADDPTIREECRRIALGVWDFIKNSGDHPGAECYALDWVAPITGKRESRRFLGPVILSQNDVYSTEAREDAVAYGGWPIDVHPIHGIDATDEPPCTQNHFAHLFAIPYGVYHSRNVENLFLGGRAISATHIAFAATRVMATCGVGGQAIGTAAALLCETKAMRCEDIDLSSLRRQLVKDDCFLPGYAKLDPQDLAPLAEVSVSSGNHPQVLTNGLARDLHAEWGFWSTDACQRWTATENEATVTLSWPKPVTISEVRLTFDTGLARELILTGSDHMTKKTLRKAQPECTREYSIEINGKRVAEETDNTLRHRVHRFEPIRTASLEIHLHKTHGDIPPSLYEIRAY